MVVTPRVSLSLVNERGPVRSASATGAALLERTNEIEALREHVKGKHTLGLESGQNGNADASA